jgi:thiamine biosynthesis lipoprotein
MGTLVTIEADGAECDAAIDRAFDWFHLVEQTCTRFDPRSELCQLTQRPGVAVPVSRILFEAVRFAVAVAGASDGAFDPTVGGMLQQRGFNREHRTGAVMPVLAETPPDVSFRDVAVDEPAQAITLRRPLLLDLGAVAKGLAVDLAARELAPLRNFAIDAGGDLYLGGANRDGRPWSIGIRHPRQSGECIAAARVSDQAICTSGDYERRVPVTVGGRQLPGEPIDAPLQFGAPPPQQPAEHHIVDPRTGASPEALASVTVIAASAMLADAFATTAFVLGPDEAVPWLERMGVEGLVITRTLEIRRTKGWPDA